MLLIGTDEAGYGPNLGPLVIAATAWRLPLDGNGTSGWSGDLASRPETDLYTRLQTVVTPAAHARRDVPVRLPIADSKQIHASAAGLGGLESGVLTFADAATIASWRDLWPRLAPRCPPPWECGPFYDGYDAATPRFSAASELTVWKQRVTEALDAAGIECLALRAVTVFPRQFNEQLEAGGGKADILSGATLGLVRDLLDEFQAGAPALVLCDKHGGRSKYLDWLQRVWPDPWVEAREESLAASRYRWGRAQDRVEIEFRARGESAFPCALASMAAKYLRERAMEAFNAFWQARIPDLRPTAGYPEDAKRFRQAVAAHLQHLAIPDDLFWRRK